MAMKLDNGLLAGIFLLALMLCAAPALAFDSDAVSAAAERIATEAGARRVVVIGEMHGTREAPAVTAALARHYAGRGPVLVGLEVSRSEHAALSAFMRSNGSAEARQAMREGEFWSVLPEQNDGRRTEDLLDLVDAVRQLRVAGRDVAVVPFDIGPDDWVDSATRDRDMANYLRAAFQALPEGRMLVLTGNVHAMLKPPSMIDDGDYRTATQLLVDLEPFAVHLTASSGEFWACGMGACGARRMSGSAQTGVFGDTFHFQYALPRYTVARLIGEEE